MAVKKKDSILWMTNPLEIKPHLPRKLPDYESAFADRLALFLKASSNLVYQHEELRRCRESFTYFAANWLWLYNPHRPECDRFPWLAFDFQADFCEYLVDVIRECNALDAETNPKRENIAVPKCRETAGSFSVLAVFLWFWLFHSGSFLVLSRKEEEVDTPGIMDTPFEKLRFMLRQLPPWMRPTGFNWKHHALTRRLVNPETLGSIGGESFNPNAGAGGRVMAVLFDEFARTLIGMDYSAWTSCFGTSKVRIAVSTAEGPTGKFAALCGQLSNQVGSLQDVEEKCTIISFDWWKDPRKMQNATFTNGELTSPWFEEERANSDRKTFASQVLIEFKESGSGAVYGGEIYSAKHRQIGLRPLSEAGVIVSLDPGVHFFMLISQILECGCYRCYRERYWKDSDIDKVGEEINRILKEDFPGYVVTFIGDPAGNHVSSSMQRRKSEFTYLQEQYNIPIQFRFMYQIPRNEWISAGIQAVKSRATRFCAIHQSPQLLVDPKLCPLVDAGLGGHYRRMVTSDGIILDDIDEQHPIEDAMDCLKYPPLFKKLFTSRTQRGVHAPNRQECTWSSPSELRGW